METEQFFECAKCKGVFEQIETQEEMDAIYERTFKRKPEKKDVDLVCEPCYKILMSAFN